MKSAKYKIKTIDVQAKEWFDRTYANSYFSARITLNYGMSDEKTVCLPFQYGYGDHYMDMAGRELLRMGLVPLTKYGNGSVESLWRYCLDNKIILRYNKEKNCLKRDVKDWGIE